jgi:DNA topoisomerase-2
MLLRMLDGEEPQTMTPWFKGFTGSVELICPQRGLYITKGVIKPTSDTQLEISELPVGLSTQAYKQKVRRRPHFISDQNFVLRFFLTGIVDTVG